jgi:hypothetical protein
LGIYTILFGSKESDRKIPEPREPSFTWRLLNERFKRFPFFRFSMNNILRVFFPKAIVIYKLYKIYISKLFFKIYF